MHAHFGPGASPDAAALLLLPLAPAAAALAALFVPLPLAPLPAVDAAAALASLASLALSVHPASAAAALGAAALVTDADAALDAAAAVVAAAALLAACSPVAALDAASAAAVVAAAVAHAAALTVGLAPIREFATLTAGYAACESEPRAFPFVVRRCAAFAAVASEAAVRSHLRLEALVTGYRDDGGYTDHVRATGAAALAAWEQSPSAAAPNVIDSEATRPGSRALLPAALAAVPGSGAVPDRLRLAYVLSPLPGTAGDCGELHCDPPMGSGWQFLCRGRKTWFCVDEGARAGGVGGPPRFTRQLCRAERVPPDMARVALTARVLTATTSAGDFLSFPVGWAHAVATLEPSIGLSGYGPVPSPRAAAAAQT